MEIKFPTTMQLLDGIGMPATNELIDTAQLRKQWYSFHDALNGDKQTLLHAEYQNDKIGWIDYLQKFARDKNNLVTNRVAALRLLARVAGQDIEEINVKTQNEKIVASEYIYLQLWEFAVKDSIAIDLCAWAIYSQYWCNVEITDSLWAKTHGHPINRHPVKSEPLLHITKDAKLREWLAQSIGEMAKNAYDERRTTNLRMAKDAKLFAQAEKLLISQWYREIDVTVDERIIWSLGHVSGRVQKGAIYQLNGVDYTVVHVLYSALEKPRHIGVVAAVPETIQRIGQNLAHSRYLLNASGQALFDQLTELVKDYLQKNNRKSYDLQRNFLLALTEMAAILTAMTPMHEQNVEMAMHAVETIGDLAVDTTLKADIRTRAIYSLERLAQTDATAIKDYINNRLLVLIGDPDDDVGEQAVDTMIALGNTKEELAQPTMRLFLDLVLDRDKETFAEIKRIYPLTRNYTANQLVQNVHKRATRALKELRDESLYKMLRDALNDDNSQVVSRARDALQYMGGADAVAALIEHDRANDLDRFFFSPVHKIFDNGWDLLGQANDRAQVSFWIALIASLLTIFLGMCMMAFTVGRVIFQPTVEAADQWLQFCAGLGSVIFGWGIQSFWSPVQALQKTNAEIVQATLSFENYLMRSRLISLGFAHAYTRNDWSNYSFLEKITTLAGKIGQTIHSRLDLIGRYPDMSDVVATTQVPNVIERPVDEALNNLMAAQLRPRISGREFSDAVPENSVVSQKVWSTDEALTVALNTNVQIVLSKGPSPATNQPANAEE